MNDDCMIYEVRFRGILDPHWAGWFEGFTLTALDNGDSILRGTVRDQSELAGLLEKIRSLNLKLISVNPV
jgi:hypothetical protein